MYVLERELVLGVGCDDLWSFIAAPANLNLLTPPQLQFHIASALPDRMYNGLLIHYRISIPRFGTWRWLTEIKHIKEGVSFVDEQRFGPYRFWYHEHHLEVVNATRTRMIDRVTYALPFGPLGAVIHRLSVQDMLQEIFAYRREKLLELYPARTDTSVSLPDS